MPPIPIPTIQQHVERYRQGCGHDQCSLPGTRVVLGRGTMPCDVVLVGEAPGQSENAIGKPFCGPAGHLLDSVIKRSSLSRLRLCPACLQEYQERQPLLSAGGSGVACRRGHGYGPDEGVPLTWAFTNVVCCLPRGESLAKVKEPTDEQVQQCSERLVHFLTCAQPVGVMCVGKLAEEWLDQGLLQGIKLPTMRTRRDRRPVVGTMLHPAYIKRQHFTQQSILEQRCIISLNELVEDTLDPAPQ